MGLLPFDDWIYHLPYMRDEVNSLHDKVVSTQDTVQSRVLLFNKQLDKFKLLISNNAVLIYIDKTVRMNDLQLKEYTIQIDALPPPVKGDAVLNAFATTIELIGGVLVLKFIVNVGKMAKNAIWSSIKGSESAVEDVVENLAEDTLEAGIVESSEAATTQSLEAAGEEITEEVVATSTAGALAATGIGIFLAVGIDVIFDAINGAGERDQLQNYINQLNDKMKIVNGYLTTVNTKSTDLDTQSVAQIKTFKDLSAGMQSLLPAGHKATFDFSFPATLDQLDKCLAAQQLAIDQFSLLVQLRVTYEKALARNPHVTKDTVISAVLITSSDWVTYDILQAIWDQVLAIYSTLMKNAK